MHYQNRLEGCAGRLRAKFDSQPHTRKALTKCMRDAARYLDPLAHYDLVSFISCGLFVTKPEQEDEWLAAVSEERLTPDELEDDE